MKITSELLRKRSLARGVLVVDENLFNLAPELEKKRFRVRMFPAGTVDEQIIVNLTGRTLVTNNPKDFEDEVPVVEFSIIDTTAVSKDGSNLATMISNAWIKYRLNSQANFILRLRPDGKHKLELPQ